MTGVPWRIVAACEVGTSHLMSGTPCQDSVAHSVICTSDGPVLIAVVCDGAGSAEHSEIGSWLAATTFVELVRMHFEGGRALVEIDRQKMEAWIACTAERLVKRALDDGHLPQDYSCTLLAAIIGTNFAVFAQIGDGAIVVSHGDADGWSWVFWPQHGEYANQTIFVLSATAQDNMEFNLIERPIDEFAIFSDGIERMVLHNVTKAVNDSFFTQMMLPVRASSANGLDHGLSEKLKSYLGSSPVNSRTNDDKTLFLATRCSD